MRGGFNYESLPAPRACPALAASFAAATRESYASWNRSTIRGVLFASALPGAPAAPSRSRPPRCAAPHPRCAPHRSRPRNARHCAALCAPWVASAPYTVSLQRLSRGGLLEPRRACALRCAECDEESSAISAARDPGEMLASAARLVASVIVVAHSPSNRKDQGSRSAVVEEQFKC